MSPRVAWAAVAILSDEAPCGLSQPEASRLRRRLRQLDGEGSPADRLRDWLSRRADRLAFSCAPGDASALLRDARVLPSGLSDPRSGLSAGGEAEAYISTVDLDDVRAEYALAAASQPNVWLHILPDGRQLPSRPAALGLVIADLADHGGPREDAQVGRLLATARSGAR
jgi:hypothetical protein